MILLKDLKVYFLSEYTLRYQFLLKATKSKFPFIMPSLKMDQALVLKMFIKENDNILMRKNDYLIFDEYNLDV